MDLTPLAALLPEEDWPETPFYAYSERRLEELWQHFSLAKKNLSSWPAPLHMHFAMKANNNPHILNFLREHGFGLDLVSRGELEWGLEQGFLPHQMVFSGVAKTSSEIHRALECGVALINVESAQELEQILRCAETLKVKAPLALRVNPNVDAKTHPYISTGLSHHKFGISFSEAEELYARWRSSPWIVWKGISTHIGSQLLELDVLEEALVLVLDLAQRLMEKHQIPLEVLDAGGGLGVNYKAPLTPPPFARYLSILHRISENWAKIAGPSAHIYSECGRAFCAQAGSLITRVLGTKTNGPKNFALIDGSLSELLRPALYQAWHPIELLKPGKNCPSLSNRSESLYDIAGPVCESADILGTSRTLPQLFPEDLVEIGCAGAYGYVMSNGYNARPMPAEWWVPTQAPTNWKLSRPRQEPWRVLNRPNAPTTK